MKKLVSFVLAALLLLSVVAFAASGDTTLVAQQSYTFSKDNTNVGAVKTDIYLMVKAVGQIDVTVPLILVFSTDVDGGTALAPGNYTITNNNKNSAVGVTKIEATDESNGNYKMTLVASSALDSAAANNENDKYSVVLSSGSTQTYDLAALSTTAAEPGTAWDGFNIQKSGVVDMKPAMKTTALTFVTGEDKYVKILNVKYTLGLIYNTVDTVDLPTTSILTSETVG